MEKNTKFHAGSTIVFLVEIKAEICSFVSRLAASKKRRPLCVNDYIALLWVNTINTRAIHKPHSNHDEQPNFWGYMFALAVHMVNLHRKMLSC